MPENDAVAPARRSVEEVANDILEMLRAESNSRKSLEEQVLNIAAALQYRSPIYGAGSVLTAQPGLEGLAAFRGMPTTFSVIGSGSPPTDQYFAQPVDFFKKGPALKPFNKPPTSVDVSTPATSDEKADKEDK